MFEKIEKVKNPRDGSDVHMRIGLHTGSVIGGCIGTKALRYDIWGDDPIIANEFESEGIPGMISISSTTKTRVEKKFLTRPAGQVTKLNKTFDKFLIDPFPENGHHPVDEEWPYCR